jgi:hypothetical protein
MFEVYCYIKINISWAKFKGMTIKKTSGGGVRREKYENHGNIVIKKGGEETCKHAAPWVKYENINTLLYLGFLPSFNLLKERIVLGVEFLNTFCLCSLLGLAFLLLDILLGLLGTGLYLGIRISRRYHHGGIVKTGNLVDVTMENTINLLPCLGVRIRDIHAESKATAL